MREEDKKGEEENEVALGAVLSLLWIIGAMESKMIWSHD